MQRDPPDAATTSEKVFAMNEQLGDQITRCTDLYTKSYQLLVEAFQSATQRMLANAKAVYELCSRPYSSTATDTLYAESIERGRKLIDLTVNELRTRGSNSAKLAGQLAECGAKLQQAQLQLAFDMMKTSMSSLGPVRDTQGELDALAKELDVMESRLFEMRSRMAAPPSGATSEATQSEGTNGNARRSERKKA
jgi:hypothetical protein